MKKYYSPKKRMGHFFNYRKPVAPHIDFNQMKRLFDFLHLDVCFFSTSDNYSDLTISRNYSFALECHFLIKNKKEVFRYALDEKRDSFFFRQGDKIFTSCELFDHIFYSLSQNEQNEILSLFSNNVNDSFSFSNSFLSHLSLKAEAYMNDLMLEKVEIDDIVLHHSDEDIVELSTSFFIGDTPFHSKVTFLHSQISGIWSFEKKLFLFEDTLDSSCSEKIPNISFSSYQNACESTFFENRFLHYEKFYSRPLSICLLTKFISSNDYKLKSSFDKNYRISPLLLRHLNL